MYASQASFRGGFGGPDRGAAQDAGLLLVLLQNRLPCLLREQGQQSGDLFGYVERTPRIGSGCSVWAQHVGPSADGAAIL